MQEARPVEGTMLPRELVARLQLGPPRDDAAGRHGLQQSGCATSILRLHHALKPVSIQPFPPAKARRLIQMLQIRFCYVANMILLSCSHDLGFLIDV